jgi:hypothetical protein
MHKSDMKSNPNDHGKAAGGQSKDENRKQQDQDAKHGQPAQPGKQKTQPDKQQQDQQRRDRSNQAGDQDVENPDAQRAGAPGVTRGPAANSKPEQGVEPDDQDDRNELDDEDVDTANASPRKRTEKRHSM